ncbi:hypothetical protein U7230_04345 [Carboxydochorda subterranea]|uniref:Uncharacterized protein n=1 Tax=Carboxydichorda subterranea TaxID=3109565 RepID=A0ABZ1BZP1_9FIRM|nr:hypothetical protein [Limnochorda sp. L945t]WRP18242.1 hypothetical protein U7230_04345 [Limnochorda sp. L945t]
MRITFDETVTAAAAAARGLASLLGTHPSYRVLTSLGAGPVVMVVHFTYHSAVELSRLYDQLLWFVELSQRAHRSGVAE